MTSASPSSVIRSEVPIVGGSPSGSRSTVPKSSTPSRHSSTGPSGKSPASSRKLPGCGSACSRPVRAGPEKRKRARSWPYSVALFVGAVRDHLGQRHPRHPLRHQHLVALVDHGRYHHIRIVGELLGVCPLGLCLQGVVQLLRHPVAQLGDQRFDVHARDQRTQQPGEPAQLRQIRQQRLTGARILHLDGHLAAVMPHRPVYLPDGGRRGRLVLELLEQLRPVLAELLRQHRVHRARRHRRGRFLEFGQSGAVRPGDLLGQRRLEDGQRLPELHRPALQLTEHLEKLLRGALLKLPADDLGGSAADPLAQAPGGAAGRTPVAARPAWRCG